VRNRSAKGASGEREVMALLEAEGYIPFRAAGSLGIFDVGGFKVADDGEGAIVEIVIAEVKRRVGVRKYARQAILRRLRPFCGVGSVQAYLYERQDGGKWEKTNANGDEDG